VLVGERPELRDNPLEVPERQVSKPTCMGEPGFAPDHRFGSAGVGRHVCDCEESVRSEIWDELGAIPGAGAGSRDGGDGGGAGLGGHSQTFQAPSSPLQPSARAQAVTGGGWAVGKPVEWIQSSA
jgi:hypothetical protein